MCPGTRPWVPVESHRVEIERGCGKSLNRAQQPIETSRGSMEPMGAGRAERTLETKPAISPLSRDANLPQRLVQHDARGRRQVQATLVRRLRDADMPIGKT
jgi:hypothetical protein